MDKKINIGLVEDQILFRQGLRAILSVWDKFDVIFESGDGYSVSEKLRALPVLPDVMLVDLSLPPHEGKEFSGVEVTDVLQEFFPSIRILILSVHQDENFIAQLIEHGAHGYLVKDCDPEELHQAIVDVYTKGSYINERTLRAIQNNMGRKNKPKSIPGSQKIQLTKREEEILALICRQLTSEEIAEKLFISVKTVNGHRNNLLQKTNARNSAGLVVFALKNNLVEI